jgi:hypothetical protein
MAIVRKVGALVAACTMMLGASQAGVININPSPGVSNTPNLGRVVATSTSTFRVDAASGTVSEMGTAIRLPNSSVTTPQYTITCTGNGNPCNSAKLVTVTIQAATTSEPAFIAALNVSVSSGTITSGPTGQNTQTVSFVAKSVAAGNVAVFNLGMDVTVPATATGSIQTPAYTITTTNN